MEKAMNSFRPELLEQARIAYERAEDEYRRMKMMYESNSLAPNDFQKFKAAYETAKQGYEQAKAGGQREDKQLSRAAYDQANAQLQLAAKALSDATLVAPIDGYVDMRAIEPGETASPGRPVFRIVRLNPVEVNVGVPETDLHLVRVGQRPLSRYLPCPVNLLKAPSALLMLPPIRAQGPTWRASACQTSRTY